MSEAKDKIKFEVRKSHAEMLFKAVGNYIADMESLKKKLDAEKQAEAAEKLDASIKTLRDLQNEMLF